MLSTDAKNGNSKISTLVVVAFVAIFLNLLLIIQQTRVVNSTIRALYPQYSYVADDVPDQFPMDIQKATLVFEPNSRFSLIDDKAWAALFPPNKGFVRLGPNGRPFGTALYHQLHCVNGIRFDYTVARDGLVTDREVLKSKMGHINHCFQFLRQSIMCKADTTLIPLDRYNGSVILNGFGGPPHRCRDWEQLRSYVEDNVRQWEGRPFVGMEVVG